jgi:hypothetical protein
MEEEEKKQTDVKKVLNEDLNKSLTHTRLKPESNPPTGRVTTETQSSGKQDESKKDE